MAVPHSDALHCNSEVPYVGHSCCNFEWSRKWNTNMQPILGTFCFYVVRPCLNGLFQMFLRCTIRPRLTLSILLCFISFSKVELCENYHLLHWRHHVYLQSHSCCPVCYLLHSPIAYKMAVGLEGLPQPRWFCEKRCKNPGWSVWFPVRHKLYVCIDVLTACNLYFLESFEPHKRH